MTQVGKLDLLDNRTNQEIARLALNLHLVFKDPQDLCDPGSVLKRHGCGKREKSDTFSKIYPYTKIYPRVLQMHSSPDIFLSSVKCPAGTFYNSSTRTCQPCPFGQYQNATASLTCVPCPEYTFTKRMHTRSLKDCIRKILKPETSDPTRYIPLSFFPCSCVPTRILFPAQTLPRIASGNRALFRVRRRLLSAELWTESMLVVSIKRDDGKARLRRHHRLSADPRRGNR